MRSTYFIGRFAVPAGSSMTLRGKFPNSRFFQFALYKFERSTFVAFGEPMSPCIATAITARQSVMDGLPDQVFSSMRRTWFYVEPSGLSSAARCCCLRRPDAAALDLVDCGHLRWSCPSPHRPGAIGGRPASQVAMSRSEILNLHEHRRWSNRQNPADLGAWSALKSGGTS